MFQFITTLRIVVAISFWLLSEQFFLKAFFVSCGLSVNCLIPVKVRGTEIKKKETKKGSKKETIFQARKNCCLFHYFTVVFQLPPFTHSPLRYTNSQIFLPWSFLSTYSSALVIPVLPSIFLCTIILLPSFLHPIAKKCSHLLDEKHEIRECFMEEAVSELGLDRWSRICSCREMKDLPVEGNGIEFVHFSNRVLWRVLFLQALSGTG